MAVIRTIVWVVLLIALLLFSLNNWTTVTVKIWEDLVWETRLPALVIISFLLGLVPMWVLRATGRWRMQRRINALEAASRQPSAALTSTQLDAAPASEPASD
ncbi:LapA family protein [Novosphingobium flavum]|uniref:LapA family protein n=1 Tax=Novosphingobium flavum TaxID=1778672 RepID=A0A7X1FUU7_9SPHN|nr:LapA family protein [Novosphingobium flavum]MBC2667386.1 LapA family protein [Novosphingobium flavum]